MKREIAALALLAALFAASFFNIRHLRSFTGGLASNVEASRSAFDAGDYGRAEALLRTMLPGHCYLKKTGILHFVFAAV